MISHDDIAKLSAVERMTLIAELWDSLTDEEAPFPQAQRDEILGRLDTFEEDRKHAVSWEALKAELAARKR